MSLARRSEKMKARDIQQSGRLATMVFKKKHFPVRALRRPQNNLFLELF